MYTLTCITRRPLSFGCLSLLAREGWWIEADRVINEKEERFYIVAHKAPSEGQIDQMIEQLEKERSAE